jgi:hypothetical protein
VTSCHAAIMTAMPPGVRVPDSKYTDRQRAAIDLAYDPPRVSSAKVAELAQRGRLLDVDGRFLPAFDLAQASVRSIAKRVRRGGVKDDGGLTPEQAAKLWDRLAGHARRNATSARTSEEVSAAARALADVERLRPNAELARPGPNPLAGSILAAHRSSRPHAPPAEPDPVRAPVPELAELDPVPAVPEPEPERELTVPEQIARELEERFAAMRAPEPEPAPEPDHDSRAGSGDLPRRRRGASDPYSARVFGI